MCYQDAAGDWKKKRYPEGLLRRPDLSYLPFTSTPTVLPNSKTPSSESND